MSETRTWRAWPAEPLYAAAVLAPWVLLSLLLPFAHLLAAMGLLALLAVLLVAAGGWGRRRAASRGLDADAWGFAAIASFGCSNLALLAWAPRPGEKLPAWLCGECGRACGLDEAFCFGCGRAG